MISRTEVVAFPGLDTSEIIVAADECGGLFPKDPLRVLYAFDGQNMWVYLAATGDYMCGIDLPDALSTLWSSILKYRAVLSKWGRVSTPVQVFEHLFYERIF